MFRLLMLLTLGVLIGGTTVIVVRTVGHTPAAPAPSHPPTEVAPSAPTSASSITTGSTATTATTATVNSVCPICGMDVDPSLPTAVYQGKAIGFGCKACPAKFAANPDRWGPAALANRVVE